jgi:hypothetical protein
MPIFEMLVKLLAPKVAHLIGKKGILWVAVVLFFLSSYVPDAPSCRRPPSPFITYPPDDAGRRNTPSLPGGCRLGQIAGRRWVEFNAPPLAVISRICVPPDPAS